MKNLIESKNLSKMYGRQKAMDQVNFTLRQGDIYGLIGRNGAGKSTLLKLILGIIQPMDGSISIQGSRSQAELIRARSNIGFMIEPAFYPYLSARENLEYNRRVRSIRGRDESQRVLQLLGLPDNRKKVKAYSMGMKQRLGIAAALMGRPDIVILDEPINGLDPQGIAEFRQLIQEQNRVQGITFILSSHILSELSLLATRFAFIDQGRLIQEIDQDSLHEACRKQLLIRVDNSEKATALLEEHFSAAGRYFVNGEQEIVLDGFSTEAPEIAQLFHQQGLRLYKLLPTETTLENYYFSLVGGEDHV